MMNIYDIKSIEDLIIFIDEVGIDNAPYKFYGKFKTILDDVKKQQSYDSAMTLKEIYYINTNSYSNVCVNCDNTTKFSPKNNEYKQYCSPKCCAEHNKDSITEKRKLKMEKNFEDEIWIDAYKQKISEKSKQYHASDLGKANNKIQSERMKAKILSGEFTPNITNSWTKWDAEYNGKKFRSMFDALFKAYHDENNIKVHYEKLRIPYNIGTITHTYIVDYVNEETKNIYEIKPSSLISDEVNLIKEKFARDWCMTNGYTYNIVTEYDLKQYLNSMIDSEFTRTFRKKYPSWK